MTFDEAFAFWRENRLTENAAMLLRLEDAEEIVLNHAPRTVGQAARVLEVAIADPDRRSDGWDVDAIDRVRELLATLAGGEMAVETERASRAA